MEFKIYDRTAKVYELNLINEPLNMKKKIKFFTNYNIGRKLSPHDFFETLVVFSTQKIILLIRVNQFLETVEIHKCFFSQIEKLINNNQRYYIINSFMIESIECQFHKSYTPFFLDSQYFYLIINQEIFQYNLASLISSSSSTAFILKRNLIQSPIYFRCDLIYLKNQQKLYSIQKHGHQISHNKFIFSMYDINLPTDTPQHVQFELTLSSLNRQNNNLIQNPFINSAIFEGNETILEIYFPFQNSLIKQNYYLQENSEFYFVQEEKEEKCFEMEPGIIQIWNLDLMHDQVYSLIFC